ncbi:MAG: arginase [Vicinamibacteraceae bacterium]|nr:arginase [Vicinamibacteraceae bacterium]
MTTRRPVHIIGVPLDLGAGRRGVDMGPSAFRIAGLDDRVRELGYELVDRGDLATPIQETKEPGDTRKKYIQEISAVCQALYEQALEVLEAGGFPLVLGGDHSLGAGSVAATAAHADRRGQRLGLLWIDAHGDMNTPLTSGSGNVHGMPLAALLGSEPAELAGIGGFSPKVRPQDTVLVGVRNLDTREKAMVREAGIHVYTMKDIDRLGIAAVMEQAIATATRDTMGLHVSFDLDVCDPGIAPGVGTPVRGGLDYREAHMAMEMLADSERLLALDMVEVNPVLDVRNSTATLGTELVLSALGQEIL